MKQFGWIFIVFFLSAHLVYAGTLGPLKSDDTPWKDLRIRQAYLSIGGTYRLRSEFQDEYNIQEYGTGENEGFLLSRLRLDLDLKFRNLRTFVQFQDARIFGSRFDDSDFSKSNPYHDNMDIRQAYVDYLLDNRLKFKLGRQQIAFGDRRIFGLGNWGNTGRYVWDAAKIRFSNSRVDSHTFFGRYIIRDPDRWPNKHATAPTAYANYTMIKNLPFDGVFSGADTVLYGWMNMFFWSNIREYRIDTELSPMDKLSFRCEYHYFNLDQKKDAWYYPGKAHRRDETGASGRELGHEIDLTFHYKAAHWFDLRGGYCLFFPGDFIRKTSPNPDASWAFLQTVFSF